MINASKLLTCTWLIASIVVSLAGWQQARGGDWPMWRGGPGRTGVSPDQLPETMHLQWTIQLPAPKPAWPADQQKLQFDGSYEPVVMDGRIFVPSMIRDSLTAYDTKTGGELWRFYADGPVRLAPVAAHGKVYFASDDSHLYCLSAASGKLVWKFRGGPSDSKILGNDRLISMWPARGGPVLRDGTIYFTAGIWPFMGTFIHALDAETGAVVWTNSGSGSEYIVQPHNSPAFAGVSPQGYLAASQDVLLVSGGRTVPAAYDRKTGKFLYFHPGRREFGKVIGGYDVMAGKTWFANRGAIYSLADGEPLTRRDRGMVLGRSLLELSGGKLTSHATTPIGETVQTKDRRGRTRLVPKYQFEQLWQASVPDDVKRLFIKAGRRVYAAGEGGRIFAVNLPSAAGRPADVSWKGKINGHVWNMLAADDRLLVVSREGAIYCFGASRKNVALSKTAATEPLKEPAEGQPPTAAGDILAQSGVSDGYCLVLGFTDERLLVDMARRSKLHVIAVDPDAEKVAAVRRRLDDAGLLGHRIAVISGDGVSMKLPPYMANLIVCQDPTRFAGGNGDQFVERVFRSLRPYDGIALLGLSNGQYQKLASRVGKDALAGGRLQRKAGFAALVREGSLPGSAPWTHNNADVANTLISQDRLVKAPLGVLWFGGPSNQDVLPRHGHGPSPQVVGGRLVIEGPNMLRAVDVYTGRLLWQRRLKDLGLYYNNTGHHPGAGAIGGNYVSLPDAVYVAYNRQGLRLDPATGKTLATFVLPPDAGGPRPFWGYVGVSDDVLIAGSSPTLPFSKSRWTGADRGILSRFGEGSRRLVVMDRFSGDVLWKRDAAHNFRHNAIAAGGGKVFCIDKLTDERLSHLRRRGKLPDVPYRLYALDAHTGQVAWSTDQRVFGTWLSYSAKHDLLLQAGSKFRDRAKDEAGKGMVVYHAASGKVLWQNDESYGGPCLIHGDTIITQGGALSLLTGRPKRRRHPLTAQAVDWTFSRNYGCNTVIGCTNLLTFRSAAAGYFDLAGDGGTGNLGGFRSSCTSNLIPADGVLNAPDYTRTCTCSYQNQCSLALVHMPEAEMWTFNSLKWDGRRVRRIGINFGAPGDRRAPNGTLWLDYPSVGGDSPDVPVQITGGRVRYFRHHASRLGGDGPTWVAASGVRGAETIRVTVAGDKIKQPRRYTVRLHFAENRNGAAGSRAFDVSLQGKPVLQQFDIAQSAGGTDRGVVRQFNGVEIKNALELTFSPSSAEEAGSSSAGVLAGIELLIEDP